MNGPLILQKDNVDQLPPAGPRDVAPWGAPIRRPQIDWRVVAVLCAFALIGGWLVSADVRSWLTEGWGRQVALALVWGSLVIAALFAIRRVVLVDQPGGFKVPLWQLDARPVVRGALGVQLAYAERELPNVAAFTLTNPQPQLTAPIEAEVIEAGPNVGPLPREQWLAWLDSQPHALFAAKTGKGKSTTAKAGLKQRIAGGEQVFIIDPHANDWWLPSVGGGENWQEIRDAIHAVSDEYKKRLEFRASYKHETGNELGQYHFPRLTIVLDEANACRAAFDRLYSGSRKTVNPWLLIMEVLGSGARKVGISIWPLAQSALVEDLGLSSAMRQNFTRFALDDYTIRQMVDREERSPERKKAIYAALPGMQYPATAIVDAEVYLLDRTGLDHVSPPANCAGAAWDGWPPKLLAEPEWPAWATNNPRKIAYLAKTTQMSTREIRDAVGCDYNLVCEVVRRIRNAARK